MSARFDAIVIGAGQAGPPLAERMTKAGMKVAVIERSRFGGTCVNTGCMPTKALVASAYAAHLAGRGADFGFAAGEVRVDMKAVAARAGAISARASAGVESWLRRMDNCVVYQGSARFESPGKVRVGADLLEADRIFINVGARAATPHMPGIDQISYLTNSSMVRLDVLPSHLAIIGGSYIGLEFAQIYRRFGAKVTVVEMAPRLVSREDSDVSAAIKSMLESEGVDFRVDAECIRFARRGEDILVGVNCLAGEPEIACSHVLLAIGRRPNTDDLGLDATGVAMDARGHIIVDDQLRASVPGVWALGECNGRGAFTHTAYNDFEIVAANLLDHDPRRVSERIEAYALYVDPPYAKIGMSVAAAKASGRRVLVGERPMTRVGRAVEKGETTGFMRILVDADSREILGAAIFGTGGDEAIHCVLDLMYAKAPYSTLQRAVHIHPTVSELLPTLLGELKPLA
ncbi:FAD-dependent pyridine nucleotide-disulphide oxidoreductase [Methylocella silvestris BL2]|uniref:FAD-dependent pyridine nucleotide-disulphide oxidoreductase n=1 Tax=Methylocella silvestris (strain DSM 15510 / CIP 108128 / LMG 27833 / NCIMB 13906 / BL2) TaxID=395965 RepID=B8ETF1_METSB|nr:FAD-containing oxidoreductase [Methylocella silvestris]ACK51793.1 FAD-dependent pyridine nucleotide-disulphide oxidoreductase [Methylocella silvestris BL2]